MLKLPDSLQRAINEFAKLPGIGPKSAQRLAFFMLKKDSLELRQFSEAIADVKSGINFCDICHNMSEHNLCSVCGDSARDQKIICVVEEPLDAIALDKTGSFKGVFHILGGILNPMEGIGPEKLNIQSLISRIQNSGAEEIIIATNPTLEGETTAMHIARALAELPVKVSRIARGLPMGGDLEYADEVTLSRALDGRREI